MATVPQRSPALSPARCPLPPLRRHDASRWSPRRAERRQVRLCRLPFPLVFPSLSRPLPLRLLCLQRLQQCCLPFLPEDVERSFLSATLSSAGLFSVSSFWVPVSPASGPTKVSRRVSRRRPAFPATSFSRMTLWVTPMCSVSRSPTCLLRQRTRPIMPGCRSAALALSPSGSY